MIAPRTLAIGDIHGCDVAFNAILEAMKIGDDDLVVTLGDYIDRGPNSRAVLDRLIRLDSQCQLVPLLGNHEVMMMCAREDQTQRGFWLDCGGRETLESYGPKLDVNTIREDHIKFIRKCPCFFETDTHIFLHANYLPQVPLDQQPDLVLLWEHLTDNIPERHMSGKTAIVGHTPQRDGDILDLGHVICIDTYCFGGGWLTALDLTNGIIWQVNREGYFRHQWEP